MVNGTHGAPTASFNTADGTQILQVLHDMRFKDHAMSATQGLAWGTLQQQFGAGKLGMYIAAPDDIYNVIVRPTRATSTTSAWARCPASPGPRRPRCPAATTTSSPSTTTPGADPAGLKWINFESLTPGTGQFNYQRLKADGFPVGFPEPQLFQGPSGSKINDLRAKYATINTAYYQPFVRPTRPRRASPRTPRPSTGRSTPSCWPC